MLIFLFIFQKPWSIFDILFPQPHPERRKRHRRPGRPAPAPNPSYAPAPTPSYNFDYTPVSYHDGYDRVTTVYEDYQVHVDSLFDAEV